MIPEHVQKAIMEVEKQVLSILKAHKLVKPSSRSLKRAEIEPAVLQKLNIELPLVTEQFIAEWRKMWPPRLRGDKTTVSRKMMRFMTEYKVDVDVIRKLTDAHLASHEPPYCGNANNFFYYYDRKEGVEKSRAETAMEILDDFVERSDNSNFVM